MKHSQLTRLLAVILLLTSVTGMSASCGSGSTGGEETVPAAVSPDTAADAAEAEAEETEAETTVDDLFVIGEHDYEEKTFAILTTETQQYEYDAEEYTGEGVNDAIYDRNAAVAELLGITFDFVYRPGDWANAANFQNLITNSVMAQDGAYDIVSGMISCTQPIATSNYCLSVYDIPHINLNNPWWVSELQNDLTVNGKLFGFIGDVSLSMYKGLSVIFANQGIITDSGMDNPYELVKGNMWTLDTMTAMAGDIAFDSNGDGKIVYTDDLIGMTANEVVYRSIQASFDMHVIDIGEDGIPAVLPVTDAFATAVEKLNGFWKSDSTYIVDGLAADKFVEGHSLFYMGKLESLDAMRDMEADYAILPFPKYDENQAKYLTLIATATQMYYIPVTTNDPELTGLTAEALSYYSYKNVVPAYYEVSLKNKYSHDEDTQEMLDIIRDGAVMPFEYCYSTTIAGNPWPNKAMSDSSIGNGNIASTVAAATPTWQANIDKIMKEFE